MQKYLDKLFYSDKWNIGYVYQTATDFIQKKQLEPKVTWLKEDTVDYAADPFVLSHESEIYIYYEELKDVLSKGEIKKIDNFNFASKQIVNGFEPKNIHLSYPYIFYHQKQVYCIPETSNAFQVALYQININDLTNVKKIRILLTGERYVDSSIIWFNDKFWLFTSVSDKPNAFYIYYADSLQDRFLPHALNPIQTSNKNFRNAGNLFMVDGKLFRPTQSMELRYGGAIVINQINELSETKFESTIAFELAAQLPYDMGLHNISIIDGLIVVDGKRKAFSMIVGVKKTIRKVRFKSISMYKKIKTMFIN